MKQQERQIRIGNAFSLSRQVAERLREGTPSLPSWLLSFVLHVGLCLWLATTLKGCGTVGPPGPGDVDYREVGIYLKHTETPPQPQPSLAKVDGRRQQQQREAESVEQSKPVPDEVDAELAKLLKLPKVETPGTIGPGAPVSSMLPARPAELTNAPAIRSTLPSAAAGQGETSFFNIRARGTRFVYVLDRSGSMASYHALQVAKAELLASLESLQPTQQFQIIFYNETPSELTLGSRKRHLFWATDINRTLARQFIASIQADGGTDHMLALRRALRYGPEHIFFLTDADQPQLTAADLDEIRRLNHGRAKIHCIEFGRGPPVPVDNFLKRLARQTGGAYQYRDVTKFIQP